ncbi:hypothetical protein KY360_05045 [Candidatus Woesearchaeota archaeon]|nr:hypothetical protein [Candidatus Woesearchaeota archaeon]
MKKAILSFLVLMLMAWPLASAQEMTTYVVNDTQPECVVDDDCGEGEACTEGACVEVIPPPECVEDADCEEEEVCTEGACEAVVPPADPAECVEDADCEEGEACTEGACEAAPADPPADPAECVEDGDCEEEEVCTEGACEAVVPPADPAECVEDADCEEEEVCTEGACEAVVPPADPAECVEDADCGEGEACTEGACELDVPPPPEDPGITPDSPLYGLDRAIERISLKLTLGKSAKAKKGLAHARERLMEVQAMIAAKKMGAAAEAQEEHDDIMDDVNDQVADLGDGDIGEELADELELEAALDEHEEAVQELNSVRLKAKGALTAEQQTQVDALVASLEASAVEAKINVQVKKEKTKIKIKATQGLTDEELDALEAQAREIVGQGGKVKILGKKGRGRSTTETGEEEPEDEEPEEDEEESEEGETEGEEEPAKGKGKDKSDKGRGRNK